MEASARILIIEDDPDGCVSLKDAVEDAGFEAMTAMNGNDGVNLFRTTHFDTVISDLVLPDIDGIEVLKKIRKINSQIPVIIITAYGTVPSSVRAIQAGAYDYLSKPLDLDELQLKLRRAVETVSLRKENTELKKMAGEKYMLSSMVAASPQMKEISDQVRALAETNATVLIEGESGTGKELIARALHAESKRSTAPFVAVNCGGFTETLLESELFGHEKGSFTGAGCMYKGAFERAHGGTLFLDEIGDAPKSLQTKLLRAIEERELLRVGGSTNVKIDVRIISATNKSLSDMVESGDFRQDLYYRMKVITINLPPLRERKEDIRPLVDRFIASACHDHGRNITAVEPDYYNKLEAHVWPGNVRQLRNTVEASVVMTREPVLKSSSIQLDNSMRKENTAFTVPSDMSLSDIEREILSQLLQRYEGNRSLTADKLGISRRTIQRKIKDLNLPF